LPTADFQDGKEEQPFDYNLPVQVVKSVWFFGTNAED